MLPFLNDDSLSELVDLIVDKKTEDITLNEVIPFLDEMSINRIYTRFVEKEIDINITDLFPYLEANQIMDLYQRINNGEFIDLKEEEILPYLDEDNIKDLFNQYVNSKK